MGEKVVGKTKEKGKWSSAFVLALISSFLLTIYAPLETYFTNKNEFWFDFYSFIGTELMGSLVVFVVLFGILFLSKKIHEKLYRFVFVAGSVLLLDFYVEGTFLANGLPILDGRSIDWSQYLFRRRASAVLLVVLIVAAVITVRKFTFPKVEKTLRVIFCVMGAMLFITLISLTIMNDGLEHKRKMIINKDKEYEFSTTQNLIVFIIDAVDGDVFEQVLEQHPEYREEMRDFTYYSDMLSTYTQTDVSLGYLMTGVWFEDKGEEYEDYLDRAYAESQVLDKLEQADFRIGTYLIQFLPLNCDRIFRFDNVKKSDPIRVEPLNFLKLETKLVGYRYAPFELKRFCNVDTRSFMSSRKDLEKIDLYYDLNTDFYSDVKTKEVTVTSDKIFKLMHIEGAHVPFIYDKDVNVTGSATYESNIEATFTIVSAWLEKIRKAGVYDNSAIIIMADHGFSMADDPKGRNHPVFFVKGINEHSESLRTSAAPVSFEDLVTSGYDRLIAGMDGQSIFDWKEGEQRDRKCYFLSYPDLYQYLECIQHGKANDVSTLEVLDQK